MGLFGLSYFVLKCVKLLAWPSFALAYPLCSSIQAIETNSNYHMRKMVIYWILFSLVCLFEHTFSGLLQWLPVWPYAKILAILWLVITRFDGASIAYDSVVRPCLSAQTLRVVLGLLNKNQDLSLEGESFLVMAQRYVDEHGATALEKLISLKPKFIEPTFSQDDIKVVEILNESAAAAENKITTKLNADARVKNMTARAPYEENVQREWTCAVCQVTATSEAALNSHLQGRKHRTKCEELKSGKQMTKKVLTIGGPNRVRYCAICQVKTQSEATWNTHLQSQKHKSKCEEFNARVQAAKKNNFLSTTTKLNLATQDLNKSASHGGPSNKFRSANKDLQEASCGVGPNNRFGCDLCQVTTQSEASLKSHLQGKKHKAKREQLKTERTTENDPGESLSGITNSSAPANNKGGQNNLGRRNNNNRNNRCGQQQQHTATVAYSAFTLPGWSSPYHLYWQYPPSDVPPCLYPTAATKSNSNSGLLGPVPCEPSSTAQAYLNADLH